LCDIKSIFKKIEPYFCPRLNSVIKPILLLYQKKGEMARGRVVYILSPHPIWTPLRDASSMFYGIN